MEHSGIIIIQHFDGAREVTGYEIKYLGQVGVGIKTDVMLIA